MKVSSSLSLGACLLLALAGSPAAESDLAKRVTAQDGWVGWTEPMVADAGMPCCFAFHGRRAERTTCDLDSHGWNIGTSDDEPRLVAGDLAVYAHVAHGAIDKVRAYATACALRDPAQVRTLDAVAPSDSVALLADLAAHASGDLADAAVTTVALHAEPAATGALERLATPAHERHLREQALFWLAQARGAEGAHIVEQAATHDDDPKLRAQAVFDLSQAHGVDAYASIRAIAQHDASEHVREQALFWMAQTGDARAHDDIVAAIGSETSASVREQAVFALSQLKGGQSDAALIALVRGNYPRKVKEQALFWLGQSGSDTAMAFLDEVLARGDAHKRD